LTSNPAPPGGAAPADGPPPGGSHQAWLHDVAAYVMNALPPAEEFLVQAHIEGCPECQQELAQFHEVAAALEKVPEQAFIDGPPENAEFLIRGTLRRIRAEAEREPVQFTGQASRSIEPSRSIGRPRVRYFTVAAAAAAVLLAVAVGAVIGRSTAPVPSAAVVAGTIQATSTDSRTGARLTARIVPAQGWVRVTAATAGIKAGQRCTLYVVSRAGERVKAGSWLVSENAARRGVTIQGSALTPPADVAAVEIENSSGEVLVRTEV
jgi:anti-sigma factor RsiW